MSQTRTTPPTEDCQASPPQGRIFRPAAPAPGCQERIALRREIVGRFPGAYDLQVSRTAHGEALATFRFPGGMDPAEADTDHPGTVWVTGRDQSAWMRFVADLLCTRAGTRERHGEHHG